MIEKLQIPEIELRYGGPALADEVHDAVAELTHKINEIIETINANEDAAA